MAETNEKQETTRYIRGLGLISSDSEKAKTYYHYASDERGSITDIVKAAVKKKLAEDAKKEEASPVGNVTTTANEQQQETGVLNHCENGAFGNTLVYEEQVENRFRFTGEIYDSVTGQYYLRARFYNPLLGRFLQEDDRYDDGLNLYAYCRNNPVKYTDPSGHGTTSGSDRVDDNADFYEDLYDSQYDTIPEYEDFLQDMQDAQNEGTNQSALYDLVDEMNQSGGLDAEDQSTIHDWADEYGVDYDSLGVNAIDEGGGTSANGLIGHDFEDYLSNTIGGDGSFSAGGRDFDGGVGNRWWEAKSGNYWKMLESNPNKLAKFKSDMGDRLRIAAENGATYELFSNTPIPESIKNG